MKKLPLLKGIGLTSAVALIAGTAGPAYAQTETVNAQLITNSAITTVDVSDMDFGEYFLIPAGGDNPTLTLTDTGAVNVTVANNANSTVTQLTAPATEGVVTVQVPAAVGLTMTRTNTVDIADAGLSLTAVTYRTATENGNINADNSNGPVTVVAGATPETVTFGGTITATAQPADATHTAQFDVTFTF